MRILELGKYYPPVRGGMESALEQICQGLRGGGHQIYALVSSASRRASADRAQGVAVHRLARCGQLFSVPLNPGLPVALRRAQANFRPDLAHLHLPNPAMAAGWLLLGRPRIPLVVSYHSDIVRQRRLGALLEPLHQRVLARAVRIVVTSESLRDRSASLAPHRERCRVVPLGVDLAQIPADPSGPVEPAPFARYVLFVGRMVYYKGLDVLLEALRDTPIPLVVVGEGPLRRRWEAQARARGLAARVRFVGEVSPARLDGLYRACLALVLPSTAASETFGLVQLEAMARARAVVAARASGGVASVHRANETGLLVPAGDVAALRQALLSLWEDPSRAEDMGKVARAHVAEHYRLRDSILKLQTVLSEACDR